MIHILLSLSLCGPLTGPQALLAGVMQELPTNLHWIQCFTRTQTLWHLRQLQLRDHHPRWFRPRTPRQPTGAHGTCGRGCGLVQFYGRRGWGGGWQSGGLGRETDAWTAVGCLHWCRSHTVNLKTAVLGEENHSLSRPTVCVICGHTVIDVKLLL